EYINPSKTNVPTLNKPKSPHLQLIKPTVTLIVKLNNSQIPCWNAVYCKYENKKRNYIQQKSAINRISTYITTTISATYIELICNQPTVYNRLVVLQKLLAPTHESWLQEIKDKYRL
ncbi:hypothetical protein K469DRAFT_591039, partial [Zopfia rhizophila CBS 207.26]